MPAGKLKPVEAGDGSYAGLVLEAFDNLPTPAPAPYRLTSQQIDQLLLLRRLGATTSENAVSAASGGLNAVMLGAALVPKGLVAKRGGRRSTELRPDRPHYYLTPAGIEQAEALALEEGR